MHKDETRMLTNHVLHVNFITKLNFVTHNSYLIIL